MLIGTVGDTVIVNIICSTLSSESVHRNDRSKSATEIRFKRVVKFV